MNDPTPPPVSYRDAGVDRDAAARHTANIAALVHGGTGGFAGVLPLPAGMAEPMLVACTDGVGTKVLLARDMGMLDGLGQDLVAMSVNDLVCCGARPLGFLDYLAVGVLDPDEAAVLVAGIAEACAASGCVLLGGETAEMPGLYQPGHFDLAGFAVGVVDRAAMWGPDRVRLGDLIVAIPSSGVHSNGFSLVRALISQGALEPTPDLLAPTRLYAADAAALTAAGVDVHAAAHITGGGLPENLPRVLPLGLRPVLDAGAWEPGPVFERVLGTGRVDPQTAWSTFNMGVGFCVVIPQDALEAVLGAVPDAALIGYVEAGEPGVRFA